MRRTDRVVTNNGIDIEDDNIDFYVDTDIRRNIIVTFVNDTEFEPGDKIMIITNSLQDEIKRELKQTYNKRIKE